jgi:hypothetical protein
VAVTVSLLAWLTFVVAPPARADIAVTGVNPASGVPGEKVTLRIGCGGCPPRGLRLPVSLVPLDDRPLPYPCRPNALCRPRAASPPKHPPFIFLGRTTRTHRLRFQIPDTAPGVYAFVIYCASCQRGPGGSLIANDERDDLLRIRRDRCQAPGLVGGV